MKIKVAGTPVPNRDIEQRSNGCGPVITYRLTEEELKKMREKEGPACGLTRQALLEAIAAGETLSGVERAWGMKYNTIHFWVKKWGLKGITPDKARELLKQEPADSEKEVPADSVSDPREELAEKSEEENREESDEAASPATSDADLDKQKDVEIERLREALKGATIVANQAGARIRELEKKMRGKEGPVNEGTLGDMILRALDYYTGRKSDVPVADDDPINHPAHYTAGKVECIDAIEAATTGLDGFSAYCTGCAIKYLWRWNRKGGVEDLRKALWYVDRLIGYVCYQRLGQKE